MYDACGEARNATASAISSARPHRPSGTPCVIRSTSASDCHNCRAAPSETTGPGRDGVDPNPMPRPLDRQRLRHRHHAGLGRRRVNRPGTARPRVVGQDRHDGAAAALRDHAPADGARAVIAAVQHDADDGVPAVRREILGAAHEVAGGVVDEQIDAAALGDRAFDHRVHRGGIADVDRKRQRVAAVAPERGDALVEMDWLRLAMTTRAPRRPSARAMARPMPVPPPVTSAVCPSKTRVANITSKCTARW